MRFAAAVVRESDGERAGLALARAIRKDLKDQPVDLAFLFFSSHYANRVDALSKVVGKELTPRHLLGCTGEGIIAGDEEIESDQAVTLWAAHLPGVRCTPLRLSFTQEEGEGVVMEGWPDDLESGDEQPTFILLADPFSTPVNDVLSLLADRYPGSVAIGGLAGGGHDLGENRLVLGEEVFAGGLIGIAVSGPVSIRTVVSQGCRPIGDRYVVTKADKNVIHELGGAPALERLQAAFESLTGDERRNAHRALHLGIAIDEYRSRFEQGDFLVRNLVGADRESGSVAIGDMVKEGQTVQFHLRDAQSATEDLNRLLAAERTRHEQPPLGALLFSCCGRGESLFARPHHDASMIKERMGAMPVAGFFAQGEIGPVGGSNFLHGYTASVALFSERVA